MAKISLQTTFSIDKEQKRKYESVVDTVDIANIARTGGVAAANSAIDGFIGKYTTTLKQILGETINSSVS